MPKGVYERTEETCARMRIAHKGKRLSKSHRDAIGDGQIGRRFSEQTRDAISKALTVKRRTVATRARLSKSSRKAMLVYWASLTETQRRERTAAMANYSVSSIEIATAEFLDEFGVRYEQQSPYGPYWLDFWIPDIDF